METAVYSTNKKKCRLDVYAGKGVPDGKKSVALALSFRAEERTLKDKEIVEIVNKILNDVYVKLGGTLRE